MSHLSAPLTYALVAALCLTSAACSDTNEASKENFGQALEPIVADAYCEPLRVSALTTSEHDEAEPFPIFLPIKSSLFDPGNAGRDALETAAHLGLATRTEVKVVAKRARTSEEPSMQNAIRFEPTDKGRSHLRAVDIVGRGGVKARIVSICLGKGELVSVDRWTGPADMFGQRVSQVTFTQRGVDPIEGASATDLSRLAAVQQKTVPMVLTSAGWEVMPR